MKAVLISKITKAKENFFEVEMPKVKSGWILVKIFAFGLNHSEKILDDCKLFGKISVDKVLDLVVAKNLRTV